MKKISVREFNSKMPFLKLVAEKINEIISYIKGESGTGSYKKYVALLNQASTDAPVASVLENTLGPIVWSYSSTGRYLGTLTGAFTQTTKIAIIIGNIESGFSTSARWTDNAIIVTTDTELVAASDDKLVDTMIEIRIYN